MKGPSAMAKLVKQAVMDGTEIVRIEQEIEAMAKMGHRSAFVSSKYMDPFRKLREAGYVVEDLCPSGTGYLALVRWA